MRRFSQEQTVHSSLPLFERLLRYTHADRMTAHAFPVRKPNAATVAGARVRRADDIVGWRVSFLNIDKVMRDHVAGLKP